jgi:hypothetical protein
MKGKKLIIKPPNTVATIDFLGDNSTRGTIVRLELKGPVLSIIVGKNGIWQTIETSAVIVDDDQDF